MNKIYIVTEEWTNDGEGGVVPHPFTTYEKAKIFFDKLVKAEVEEYLAANAYANDDIDETENGEDEEKAYRIETSHEENGPDLWTFYEKGDYSNFHVSFTLCEYKVDCDYPELK